MGTLTLANFISEIKRSHASRPDLTDTILITQLNLAQVQLARWEGCVWEELDIDEDVTITISATPATDKIITLTKTYRDIFSVRLITGDGSSRKLDYITKRSFDKLYPEPEFHSRNAPRIYTVWKNKLELFPVPDTAETLKIRGMSWPTAFVEGTNTAVSDFDRKDDILIYLTNSTIFDMYGEYDRSSKLFTKAKGRIESAKSEQIVKPDQEIKPLSEIQRSAPIGDYWLNPFIKGQQ